MHQPQSRAIPLWKLRQPLPKRKMREWGVLVPQETCNLRCDFQPRPDAEQRNVLATRDASIANAPVPLGWWTVMGTRILRGVRAL